VEPIVYDHAKGSRIWDVDGNEYIDFISSWGPMILGHRPEAVENAVRAQLEKGCSFGAPCVAETKLAETVCRLVPSAEKARMVSSGTEATMSAIRLARGYTHRDKFIKFEGNYHGHSDALLAAAGSGVATLSIPGNPGITPGAVADTLIARYNDLGSVRALFEAYPEDVAAIIVEPIAGNMGCVPPAEGFLQGLRDLCDEFGAVLIFDEVINGFRASLGGAQQLYNVMPDITTLGKIIGGGFPVGCFAGRAEIMDCLAPAGQVYQAGTLSGNPVAMEAGLAMLTELEKGGVYKKIDALGARLEDGLNGIIAKYSLPCCVNRSGSVLTLFFTEGPVTDWDSASKSNIQMFDKYFEGMTERGFIIAPSQYECLFVSAAHTEVEIDSFIAAADEVLSQL
ncbi:MAG: glutamate-1-semialdehyde 2,1-aminomutase, partial [Eggerthellaceae bacterium]|nr:glutamate-1-semialdehyde 2,1-aminomutase [Eggerthellaceae bacterium]